MTTSPIPAWAEEPATTTATSTQATSGITSSQPFVSGQTAGSARFRIPSLYTLSNGWTLASADARWGHKADSPNNLDTISALTRDGGATWEWSLSNEFVDYPSVTADYKGDAASFIDPAVVQGPDGKVHMIVDAWPTSTGLMGGNIATDHTGLENGNLLIQRGEANAAPSRTAADYTYRVRHDAPRDHQLDGETTTLYPITSVDGVPTGVVVDASYNLYEVSGENVEPIMTVQYETGAPIQANVFYKQSEWKAYPSCYVWYRSGDVTEDGISWGDPKILDIKREGESFTGVCPGRGLVVPMPGGGQRILFQVYKGHNQTETASTIYSDDNGATWHRGEDAADFQGTGKSSESQTILLPNGGVRMYSRNSVGTISYCDSADGGITWGPYQTDPELTYAGNCMVSFINLDGEVTSPDGVTYGNLVAASYPMGPGRTNGVIRIGSIDAKTNEVTWLNAAEPRYPGNFQYSCLTQEGPGKLGLLAENPVVDDGTDDIVYHQLQVSEVLGSGWTTSTPGKPEVPSFTDVPADAWYVTSGCLDYVVSNKIMMGTTNPDGTPTGRFEPEAPITREQVVTTLYRAANPRSVDTVDPAAYARESGFLDDADVSPYAKAALAWAKQAGVACGYDAGPDAGKFLPKKSVSRQDLAVFIARYAQVVGGKDVVADVAGLDAFSDRAAVSDYAAGSLAWCNERGVMTGYVGTDVLDPQGTAQRCQAAKMLTVLLRDVLS